MTFLVEVKYVETITLTILHLNNWQVRVLNSQLELSKLFRIDQIDEW